MEKRLYRSRKERLLLGVCGGIAEYFALDPTLVRLVFILLIFASGPLLPLFYIVAAIVIPEKPLNGKAEVKTESKFEEKVENVVEDLVSGITGEEDVDENRKETKTFLPERSRKNRSLELWGWVLLSLGIIFLLSNLGWTFIPNRILIPLFLIILGFVILIKWKK